MKISKNRKPTTMIATLLTLTIAVTLAVLPTANAHDPPWQIPTYAFVDVAPNPVGANQIVGITMWLDRNPPTANGAYGDRWDGFTVEITKPDGSKETLGPFTSDPVGAYWTSYTPTQVGTYTFVFKFPGDKVTGQPFNPSGLQQNFAYINDTYLASESRPVQLVVQEAPVQGYQESPLPSGYWTRPISSINHGWWQLSGSWLGNGHPNDRVQPFSTGPETAHIMWTRPIAFGGVGGEFGDISYYDGLSYESKFPSPVILNGRLYYNEYPNRRYAIDGDPPGYGFYCVDLRTGETLWWKNDTISFGQILDDETPNEHGLRAYLWKISALAYGTQGNIWWMYDPFNGNNLITLTNVPSGTEAVDGIGSRVRYELNTARDWLALWNLTYAVLYPSRQAGSNYYWNYRTPPGSTIDARNGYSWNVSIPADLVGRIQWAIPEDKIIGQYGLIGGLQQQGTLDPYTIWAISVKQGSRGQLLWRKNYSPPTGNLTMYLASYSAEEDVFVMKTEETMQYWVYSLLNGELLWGPTAKPDTQFDFYGTNSVIADGKLLTYGYGGTLRAWDIKTGKFLWNYSAPVIPFEAYYSHYPLSLGAIADGKIYLYSSEHSPSKPQWRGSMLRCVNLTDGSEIWTAQHWGSNPMIADGYLVDLNLYDSQIYCYGKGPSATTVSASPAVSIHGSSVLIQGTVTDQCEGAKKLAQTTGFGNGIPAIADEDMTPWMEFLYQQRPCPANAKGVEVTLDALDPNGNFVHIGTVTSDSSGMFKKAFVPEIPGEYTVIATFAGSRSYSSSFAETAINVDEAPAASPPPEYPQPIDNTWTIVGVGIVLLIAISLVGIWIKKK